MGTPNPLGFIDFSNPATWESWLERNYNQQEEIWLRIAKKGAGMISITISEALDVALCYGWIDSHRKTFDQHYYLQRYSPRRSKSSWSMANLNKAEKLMETGRMKEHGYAQIRLANT
ncbi:YdeI/OmpD-associated family protein [Paenibacillus harenae]|uniref:YdeI/OmpD-associated family protein n=1 Tax=Paenibacillus harenae TaxID=306543 RepID=UPI00042A18EA|nr:hypothetical protein [Paenibacillus harenae]